LLFSFVPPKTNTPGDSKCVDKVVHYMYPYASYKNT
jgi:hypothetical protein